MFSCPGCGDNLLFDIPSQQLKCRSCGQQYDPYQFEEKKSDGLEQTGFDGENFEATIFTCPQCGGEILSTDNASAGFCSFCGASTILYTRLSNEKRPGYIIPFAKTKEDCKESFATIMKKAIFAPSDYKDPSKIDSFRGIYMPYWAFYIEQSGELRIPSSKSHRAGDYVITDHYALTGTVDAYYKGLSYDASSSFSDSISESIAPYDVKGMKAFTPSYLSGFYADTSDVPSEVYEPFAQSLATGETMKSIRSSFSGYTLEKAVDPADLHTETKEASLSLFPVWFMSYRSGDRVAYATVNGQTGKVVADIPVDTWKYLLGSLILAIPIFIGLCADFTPTTTAQMMICAALTVVASIISLVEIKQIIKHENDDSDLGVLGAKDPEKAKQLASERVLHATTPSNKNSGSILKKIGKIYLIGVLATFAFQFFSVGFAITAALFSDGGDISTSGFFWFVLMVADLILGIIGISYSSKTEHHSGMVGLFLGMTAIVLGGVSVILIHNNLVVALNRYEDMIYYVMSLVMSLAVGYSFVDIIKGHNILATRRLPQFDKKGGDDRA